MAITYVRGDIFLSRAPVLGIDYNARGTVEVTPLATACMDRYPAAFSALRKQVRAGRIQAGDYWVWREVTPWLALLLVRQSAVGATRPRYIEAIAQKLARDWQREGLQGIAITRPGESSEWPALRSVLDYWLGTISLPVVIYEEYLPGVHAPEPWDSPATG